MSVEIVSVGMYMVIKDSHNTVKPYYCVVKTTHGFWQQVTKNYCYRKCAINELHRQGHHAFNE